MKKVLTIILLLSVLLISVTISCSKDSTGPGPQNPTETWDIDIENGAGNGEFKLELKPDSTIISTGYWNVNFEEKYEVSCDYVSTAFTFNNTDFTFNADGTAHHSGINQDSDFTMTVSGSILNGTGSGIYEIIFDQPDWPDQNGTWTGILTEGEGVTPSIPVNDFIMHFQDNYIRGTGWVLLEIDGEYLIEPVYGDQTIIFEDIVVERGNVYIIRDYYWYDEQQIIINYDPNVKLGEWFLKGDKYIGDTNSEYEVTLNYPEEDYSKYMISNSRYSFTWSYSPGGASITKQRSVRNLDSNNNISFFNAVYNEDISKEIYAYCDWGLDLPFTQGTVNEYTFDLDKPMSYKSITTNRIIDRSYLSAYRNSMKDYIMFDANWFWDSPSDNFNMFYSNGFPFEKLELSFSNNSDSCYFGYAQNLEDINSIPSSVSIPTSEITSNYNANNLTFENIMINGDADQINANWNYEEDNLYVGFTYYSPSDVNEISFPGFPSEIADTLGIDVSLFQPHSIGMSDYDTCENMDDIINIVFKQQLPYKNYYNTRYSTNQYFSKRIKRDIEAQQYNKGLDY